MAGRYRLTNPLEISRPIERKDAQGPTSTIEEDEKPVPGHAEIDVGGDTITERPVLIPVKDKEVMQSIGLLRQYLRDTGITLNMNKFTSTLLKSNVLPYNPYPGFVRQFSVASEKFHTRRESLVEVQRRISQCPTFVTGSGILSGVQLPHVKLWGLQHILTAVNPRILTIYRDLIAELKATPQEITQKVGNNTAIISTLQGPSIFFGSLYNQMFKVSVGVTVLVRSSSLSAAARDFGKAVVCDIEHLLKDKDEHVLYLQLPTSGDASKKSCWSSDELHSLLSSEAQSDLTKLIADCALQMQRSTLQVLVHCHGHASVLKTNYIQVEKSYDLMALVASSTESRTSNGQHMLHISGTPYQALHEGIFIEQNESELYLSTFKKYSNIGLPLSRDITSVMQSTWQNEVAGKQVESDFLLIIHYLWLTEILQNQAKAAVNKNEESLGIQICRVLQGNGYKIENISNLITLLYEITTAKISVAQPQIFCDLLDIGFGLVQNYFSESRELTTSFAGSFIQQTLFKVQDSFKEKRFEQLQTQLNILKGYLKCLSLLLVEEAVDGLPQIRNVVSQIGKASQTEFGTNLNVDERPDAFRHCSEPTAYSDIDRKQIDVSASASNFAAPAKVSQQASRMQYCVDMRIDGVWKDFLSNLFIFRNSLPPNPHPSLISLLRQASLKVQLSREANSVIVRKLTSSKPRIHDESLGLYSLPGTQAYGLLSAVSPLNSVGFRQVSAIASSIAISTKNASSSSQRITAGVFEIQCLMSITGEALLYGSACPYLTSINTEEYCLIKGPKPQEADGILSFAKILLIYLGNLQTHGIITIRADFSELEIELNDVDAAAPRFQSQFASVASTGIPVILHLLIPLDWRYVSVRKVIHICYIDEVNDDIRYVTKRNPASPFCQVFLNSHDACEYARKIGVFKRTEATLVEAIKNAYKEYNWPMVAHLALSLTLEREAVDGWTETTLEMAGFSWKLLRSPYGTLQYCMALALALSDGIKLQLSGSSDPGITERLRKMIFGFRNCLHLVLNSQSTMCSRAVNPYCQYLLQCVVPCDLTTGTVVMDNIDKLPVILLHVHSIIQALSHSLAAEVFRCVPSVVTLTTESKD